MKTTAYHFALFKAEAERWQERLGLTDWDIRFTHEDDVQKSLASVRCDTENKLASVSLSANWHNDEPTKVMIEKSAKHEVLHVLLADLCGLVSSHVPTTTILGTEHAIVRRLERALT